MIWLPFQEWWASRSSWGGQARAHFWATQNWVNLERATFARYTLRQRHWSESYLTEFMADLSAELPAPKRRKRRK
jgi:hypothetical protein